MKIKNKIKLSLPTVLSLVLLFIFTDRVALTAVITATLLHELGHIAMALLLRIKISCFSADLLGARLDTGHTVLSYSDEILLSASGPFINILSVISFHRIALPFFEHFVTASLGLALLNLLPIESFDGGRILYCTLSSFFGSSKAAPVLRVLSFLCLFMLWCISVYFLIRASDSLSLFFFSVSLFNRLFLLK